MCSGKVRAVALAGIIAIGSFSIGYWGRAMASRANPNLNLVGFSPQVLDLGEQSWGTKVPFSLHFVNNGGQALVVDSVRSSCGCTIIDGTRYAGQTVPRRGRFEITGVLDTQKSPGAKQRDIELRLRDGMAYKAELRLIVVGSWTATPDLIDFGQWDGNGERNGEIGRVEETIAFESTSDELLEVSAPGVSWVACGEPVRSPGKTMIPVRLIPGKLAPGRNSGTVVLEPIPKPL